MTLVTHDFTVFDVEGDQLSRLAIRFPSKRIISLYPTASQPDNVSYFSEAGDPIQLSDSMEAARSAKLSFLKSGAICVLVVKDLRGLELFTSAFRLLLQNELRRLIVISKGDIRRLIGAGTEEEQRQAAELLKSGRLQFGEELDLSRLEEEVQR